MTGAVTVEVIYNVPGLPYSRSFDNWDRHASQCAVCQAAMDKAAVSGVQELDLLCEEGSLLDAFLRKGIAFQRETAMSN